MTRPHLAHRATTTVGALGGLTAAATALCLAGRTLPFPPLSSPSAVLTWSSRTDPVTVAFTVARGVGVVLVAWTALTWLLAVVARLSAIPAAVRAADGLALPFVRRLADLTAGAAIVAVSLVPAAHAGAATPDPSPLVVMTDLGPTTPGTTTTVPPTTTLPPTTTAPSTTTTLAAPPTMTELPGGPTSPAPQAPDGPSTGPAPVAPRPDPSGQAPASGTWVVHPGDTLWHVAELTAGAQLGRPASLAETATQLDRLIRLNADRLAVPGDADLVFPGQEFLVP